MNLRNISVRLTHENERTLESLGKLWPNMTRTDFINDAIKRYGSDIESYLLVPCSEEIPSGTVELKPDKNR